MRFIRPLGTARRPRSAPGFKISARGFKISARGFKTIATAGTASLLLATLAGGVSSASPQAAARGSATVDAAARALLPSSIVQSGVLADGVNLPNPPLEYQVNGTGAFTGFDIELGRALAGDLGLKLQPLNLAFTALLTSLDSGRVDIVLSGLFDTTARQAKYNIINYLNTGAQIFTTPANASKAPTLSSLCGQTVETAVGTAFIAELGTLSKSLCKGKAPLKVLAVGGSFAEEVLQIQTGRAVAAVATPDNIAYEDTVSPGKYVRVGLPFAKVPYGIDVPKSEGGLLKALVMALKDVIKDGGYAKIAKENNLQESEVTGVAVNKVTVGG
jgi:polar amino acid transport system substrate-binding protein